MANLGDRAVQVVCRHLDHDSRPTGSIRLVSNFLVSNTLELACALLDCPLYIIVGHIGCLGALYGAAQPGIGVRISTPLTGGNCNFPDQLRKMGTPLGIYSRFLSLDLRPFAVTRHLTSDTCDDPSV